MQKGKQCRLWSDSSRSSPIWVYPVCPVLSVWETITVHLSRAMRKRLMSYANNKGADQPAHPHSLISAFVVHCLDSVMSLVSVTKISSLLLASVAEQASLKLTWSETRTWFLMTRLIFCLSFFPHDYLHPGHISGHIQLKHLHLSLH